MGYIYSVFSSFVNSNMSPGWQSSTSQIAFKVENRIALTFPVLILERFTLEIPTFYANSFSDIFLSAITRSNLNIIAIIITYNNSSISFCMEYASFKRLPNKKISSPIVNVFPSKNTSSVKPVFAPRLGCIAETII